MSLSTSDSPTAALDLAAATSVSDAEQTPAADSRAATSPAIGSGLRGRLFFKLLPLAGLAWAWLLHDTELAAAGLGTWVGFVLLATLLFAAATDMATRKIPNTITYPGLAWILGLGVVREMIAHFGTDSAIELVSPAAMKWLTLLGGPGLAEQLVGAMVCFGLMFFIFLFGGTGGGDVKLAALIGAALGPWPGLTAIVATHIVGGCYGLCWAIAKFGPVSVIAGFWRRIGSFVLPLWISPPTKADALLLTAPMPMGASFVVGTLFAIYQFANGRAF